MVVVAKVRHTRLENFQFHFLCTCLKCIKFHWLLKSTKSENLAQICFDDFKGKTFCIVIYWFTVVAAQYLFVYIGLSKFHYIAVP